MALPTKKLKKCDKHVKHSKNKTCFAMWMTRWKTFSTYSHKKGEAIRMLSHTLVRKKKKARKVTMKNFLLKRANQMLFNGLAHCNKVMLSNCPFHVLTRDLGENATAKDFFNVFIDYAYIDKIIPYTDAYAHLKGDQMFTTTRVEISAYLGLNILIKIHELPQLAMY